MLGILAMTWLGLLIALIFLCMRDWRFGGALVLGYFLSLSLIHVPGMLPYLVSDFLPGFDETRDGFVMTIIGLSAFVAGAVISRWTQPKLKAFPAPPMKIIEKFALRAMIGGVVSYFVLIPITSRVPSLTSLVSPFGALLVIGLWLRFYAAQQRGELEKTAQSLLLLPLLPLATLGAAGFIGYGVNWVICVVAFFFVISRHRPVFYAAAPLVVFLGLSFFVAYMGERTGIRDLVWYENAGIEQRVERISEIFTKFQPLDLTSNQQIQALDERLNQNLLVGFGIDRHNTGESQLMYGATVPIWALVPRAIWPDKPDVGGSGDVVSDFTGIPFAKGTSVGIGQVLEFYMNFGVPGEIIGFLALGYGLMWLDRGIMDALRKGDLKLLLRCAMPGLALLQPGGSLVEIGVATAGAVIGAYFITSFKVFGVPSPVSKSVIV